MNKPDKIRTASLEARVHYLSTNHISTMLLGTCGRIYRLAILCLPLLCLFGTTAHAASFDCSKASNQIEHLICSDATLSRADEELASAYEKLLHSSPKPVILREQQRSWLTGVRSQCKDVECLLGAYRERVQVLSLNQAEMSDVKAEAICNAVLQTVNDGSIHSRFIKLQRATSEQEEKWSEAHSDFSDPILMQTHQMEIHGVSRTFGLLLGRGTCRNCEIYDIGVKAPVDHSEDNVDEDEYEYLRRAGRGGCEQFIYLMGEPIAVSGQFGQGKSRVGPVYWLSPNGFKRPLCVLEPTEDLKFVTKIAIDEGLCRAAADNAVIFIPWGNEISISRSELVALDIAADSVHVVKVDINFDGKHEIIGMADYASGAGCGSEHQWLITVTPEGRIVSDTPLSQFLQSGEWGPIAGYNFLDERSSVRIFEYQGKPYIFGKGVNSSASVMSFWGDEAKTWCEYDLLPVHTVERRYSVETKSR